MCTLSFLPENGGYIAAMNRDEQRIRPAALPPVARRIGQTQLLYPYEPGGGTWIGGNSHGNLFALLNWYSKETPKLGEKSRSRGEIIPAILQKKDSEAMQRALRSFNFNGIYPFRLFGFFPGERQIREWQWDAEVLTTKSHAWDRHHWFSSSWSDERAEAERGSVCEDAWRFDAADLPAWLRKVHASHVPAPGPYSICVHREDAATVSYTEVRWHRGELQMFYHSGNPCQNQQLEAFTLG